MRKVFTALLVATLGVVAGCKKQESAPFAHPASPPKAETSVGEPWLRLHWVGWQALAASNAAPKLQQVFALPDSKLLRDETLDKLARNLPGLLFLPTNAVTTNHAALLRPLLEDLGQAEMFFELRGPDSNENRASWTLALQLDDVRSKLWQTNLWRVMTSIWKQEPKTSSPARTSPPFPVGDFRRESSSGWEITQNVMSARLRFERTNSWVLIDYDQPSVVFVSGSGLSVPARWLDLIKRTTSTGRPVDAAKDYWLKAEVNLPRLASFTPFAGWFANLPQTQLTVSGKDEYLRTVVRLLYPQPVNLEYQPWTVPTNTIHEPLNSFTAWRGMAAWLAQRDGIKQLRIDPVPNELFLWAQEEAPYQSFAAWPVNNASNQLSRFAARLAELFNKDLETFKLGRIAYQTNINQAVWQGLPIIVPAVQVAPEPGDRHWALGLFPSSVTTNPFPAELLNQLNKPNLLYYDWELTEYRLVQWRLLAQLDRMTVFAPQALGGETTGMRWQRLAAPLFGNTATEALLMSPTEIQIIRKSHIGFTGFELMLLEKWLSSPDFPRYKFNFTPAPSPDTDSDVPPAPPKPGR